MRLRGTRLTEPNAVPEAYEGDLARIKLGTLGLHRGRCVFTKNAAGVFA